MTTQEKPMVGGKIIDVRKEHGKVRLWCIDHSHPTDEAAIYVASVPPELKVGDQLWWQGEFAYWTPADRSLLEQPLKRIGFSFDPRKENYH